MNQKNQAGTGVHLFVTVAFAEDRDLAKQYEELLKENGIPTKIKRQPQMSEDGFSDIAILVPEESLDEAHELISERANYEDFFDMVLEDRSMEQHDLPDFDDEDDDYY